MKKEEIAKISKCIEITPNLIFVDELGKDKIIQRLEKIKSIIEIPDCNNDECDFQIVMYCYSLIELLVNRFLGINTNPHFRDIIDKRHIFDFLPQNISDLCSNMRSYRNLIHLNAKDAKTVSVEDAISNTEDVFKWLSMPKLKKQELIELIHSADLNNASDCEFIKKFIPEFDKNKAKYRKHINKKGILTLPESDGNYVVFLGDYIKMLRDIFCNANSKKYSFWLKKGVFKSLKLFDYNSLKDFIASSSKQMSFFRNCGEHIDDIVKHFHLQIIDNLRNKGFEININNDDTRWITILLYSLIPFSTDDNIYDVLEGILCFYEKTSYLQAFEMASDIFWPSCPQTSATLQKQFNAVKQLFDDNCTISKKTRNDFLISLLPGKKYSCTVYFDENDNKIGLFENDNIDHTEEILKQYKNYLNLALSLSVKDTDLLHSILIEIESFDRIVLTSIISFIEKQINSLSKLDEIINDLLKISNSKFITEKDRESINNLLNGYKLNRINVIAESFNGRKTITDESEKYLLKGNFDVKIYKLMEKVNDPFELGYYFSTKSTFDNKLMKIIFSLLGREKQNVIDFLRGYFENKKEMVETIFNKSQNELYKRNLIISLKLDHANILKLKSLSRENQSLYWRNFNINNVYNFNDDYVVLYIIKELIIHHNNQSALIILNYYNKFRKPIMQNKKMLSLSIKLLHIIASDRTIDLSQHFDGYCLFNNSIRSETIELLESINSYKFYNDIFPLELALADKDLHFKPLATVRKLQESPDIFKWIINNKKIISCLNDYWVSPPGYKSNRFIKLRFNNWFQSLNTIKKQCGKDNFKLIKILLTRVFIYAPLSDKLPLKKEVLTKLSDIKIDWNLYSFRYIKLLREHYKDGTNPETTVKLHLESNIYYLNKYGYKKIADIMKKEYKSFSNRFDSKVD